MSHMRASRCTNKYERGDVIVVDMASIPKHRREELKMTGDAFKRVFNCMWEVVDVKNYAPFGSAYHRTNIYSIVPHEDIFKQRGVVSKVWEREVTHMVRDGKLIEVTI